jgi:hypothetical protein
VAYSVHSAPGTELEPIDDGLDAQGSERSRRGRGNNEQGCDAGLHGDDGRAPIGDREADIDRRGERETQRLHGRRIEPPKREQ